MFKVNLPENNPIWTIKNTPNCCEKCHDCTTSKNDKDNKKKKILCFIGWHSWTWTLRRVSEHQTEPITGKIPDRAVCMYCGIVYRTPVNNLKTK